MAERLEMAADPQVAATELILDAGTATFGPASLVIGAHHKAEAALLPAEIGQGKMSGEGESTLRF